MKRFRFDLLVAVVVCIGVVLALLAWLPSFTRRADAVHALATASHELIFTLRISDIPPVAGTETWTFDDRDGVSRVSYRVEGTRALASVVQPAAAGLEVPALYDRLVANGAWILPIKGLGSSDRLTISERTAKTVRSRTMDFDRRDLVTLGPREYHLDLRRQTASEALAHISLSAPPAHDAAYGEIVRAIRAYGTPAFQSACAAARSRAR